jgi:hypothetical protein
VVVGQCRLKIISRFDRDGGISFSGIILAQRGLPVIQAVRWWVTATANRTSIETGIVPLNATRFESSKAFVQRLRRIEAEGGSLK